MAENLLRRSVRRFPADVDCLCQLAAFLALHKDEAAQALDLYTAALAVNPTCSAALCDKAMLLVRARPHHGEEAKRLLEQALTADPLHVPSLCGLAQVTLSIVTDGGGHAEDALEAERLLKRALRLDPVNPDTLCMLGALLRDQPAGGLGGGKELTGGGGGWQGGAERKAMARHLLDRAVALSPQHVDARCQQAMWLCSEGLLHEAANSYRAALRLDPMHLDALVGHASILAVPPEGMPNCSSVGLLDYSNVDALIASASGAPKKQTSLDALMCDRLRRADDMLGQALALAPSHVPALCARGKVQCQLDNMTQAEELLRRALRLSPHDWQTLANLGVVMVRHIGDHDNGQRMFERAVEAAPTPAVKEMLMSLMQQTQAQGQLAVPLLAKDPAQVRWEERHDNYDEACLPYDR